MDNGPHPEVVSPQAKTSHQLLMLLVYGWPCDGVSLREWYSRIGVGRSEHIHRLTEVNWSRIQSRRICCNVTAVCRSGNSCLRVSGSSLFASVDIRLVGCPVQVLRSEGGRETC
jgi:hypothetical protein